MNGWPSPARPCARVFPNGILCRLFTPQKSFRWDYKPSSRVYTHAQRSHTHVNDHASPCKSSVDYGNTKTPSMHCKLDSTSLLQLTISGKSDPNFAWRKSQWDKTVVEKKKSDFCCLSPFSCIFPYHLQTWSVCQERSNRFLLVRWIISQHSRKCNHTLKKLWSSFGGAVFLKVSCESMSPYF